MQEFQSYETHNVIITFYYKNLCDDSSPFLVFVDKPETYQLLAKTLSMLVYNITSTKDQSYINLNENSVTLSGVLKLTESTVIPRSIYWRVKLFIYTNCTSRSSHFADLSHSAQSSCNTRNDLSAYPSGYAHSKLLSQ